MKKVCTYCNGEGYTIQVVNSGEVFCHGDEPITEEVPCEDCWTAEEENNEAKEENKLG